MKNVIYIILLACVFTSCSDSFLDRFPKGRWHHGNYTPDQELDNAILVQAKLQQAYADLRNYSYCTGVLGMENFTTPDAEKGSTASDGGQLVEFKPMSYTAANTRIRDYYKLCYTTIYKTNEAMALLQTVPDSEPTKERLNAEAIFLRALMYFRLTRAFGGVPYVDHVLGQEEKTPARSSQEEIYANIERELLWTIDRLPTRKELLAEGNEGRATQNAARAVLAKAYLQQNKYSDAFGQTSAIINSGDNDLSTPYELIFREVNEYGPESVLEVYVDFKPSEKINLNSQWAQVQGVRGKPNLGWGFNGPSQALMDAYEPGDPRKAATIIANGDILDGDPIVAAANAYQFFNKKLYPVKAERNVWGRSDGSQGKWVNIRLIRYADVLLMHAEAANEIGNVNEALDKLEMVRARARGNNTDVLPKVTTREPNELREKIRHERRIELALEFGRFYDLVRWGVAKDVIKNFIPGKHELFPIPQEEIDKSNGVITQNPNY